MSTQADPVQSVRIVFFASLREQTGCAESAVTPGTLETALAALKAALPAAGFQEISADNVRVALNHELLDVDLDPASVALQAGDELAFLPPVTGG